MSLVPGSAGFIRRAAEEGYRLAVVSGALRREIDLVLNLSGLHALFEVIVAAEDVANCKPSPEGYLKARRALGVGPDHGLVIEDSLPGLEAARGAGLRCAMIATSHPADADRGGPGLADLEGRSPAELPWRGT
jgi:HAD superfamily hydrolase (TIGR01509 family)